ncbi:MAG: S9 family peptidase [Anaerolineae bacterium]|nr:S9 family peptidase [Thermoflexales bacterium]MDW8407319.1 S9 family peptidase [Anaerolineae bacterium]
MKPITEESLYELAVVEDVCVSPDGSRVAFVRQTVDRAGNKYIRNIWMKDIDTGEPARPFTAGGKDTSPRWTADGRRLGFISSRDGESKLYAIPIAGGEAHVIATHRNGIRAFEWSPDDSRVAFTALVRADERAEEDRQLDRTDGESFKDEWQIKRDKEQREHEEAQRFDPYVLRQYPYRTGTEYMRDRRLHVYVADTPADFGEPVKTKPRRLTDGDLNFEQPKWSVDGQSIYAAVARDPESGILGLYTDIVRLPAASGAERSLERLTAAGHTAWKPEMSPDGRWIAFLRLNEDRLLYRVTTLALMPADGGQVVDLTAGLDRSVDAWRWSKDGAYIYFTLIADGAVNLHRVRISDGQIEQLTDATQEITSFDVAADGRIVFAASTPSDPSALYVREVDGAIRLLYQPNAAFLAEHTVRPVEAMRYESEGYQIQGWIITPPGFDVSRRWPLAVEIHGGPAVMWSAGTRSMWHEWQTLAQRGYVVFFCNPRGADGYGEAFLSGNHRDWGDGPMRDILKGVDELIAKGVADPQCLVVTGGSYGGYMTAWIIGHDNRFVAAVAQRGVYNLISMRGTCDIAYFTDWHFDVTPFDDVAFLWRHSPLAYAPQMQTPLLLEHSELDFRVPIEQAEQLFQALKYLKRTVELVRWPREGHELSRSGEPKHRVERLRRIIEWFDRYAGAERHLQTEQTE